MDLFKCGTAEIVARHAPHPVFVVCAGAHG
jgi:hypothetical protein